MAGKPRIIPDRTYVLDDKDLDSTEELTIASVIQEAFDTPRSERDRLDEERPSPDDTDSEVPAAEN